jgi:hypothetical protein
MGKETAHFAGDWHRNKGNEKKGTQRKKQVVRFRRTRKTTHYSNSI